MAAHNVPRKDPVPGHIALYRVAFLFPSLARGAYWQPVLTEFTKRFPFTVVLTGLWEGFVAQYQNGFTVKVVGQTGFLQFSFGKQEGHYPVGFVRVPVRGLVRELWHIRPHLVWCSGFSLWTLIAAVYRSVYGGKLIVMYDGSSPSVDRRRSWFNMIWRRFLATKADAFVSNSSAGRAYLVEFLGVPSKKVFVHPYEVPDSRLWNSRLWKEHLAEREKVSDGVVFLTVGRVIEPKGLRQLIEATKLLLAAAPGDNWSVLIAGDGPLKGELEEGVRIHGLEDRVKFLGHVKYEELGRVLSSADVFVFPTLEDVWGVAPLEAMAMGKPVLCSKCAGASELVEDGVNGWKFDPHNPKELAELMKRFVDQPALISTMGENAQRKMEAFSPEAAADLFARVAIWVAAYKPRGD